MSKHVKHEITNDTDEEPIKGRWILVTMYDGNTTRIIGWRLYDIEAPTGTRKTDEAFLTVRSLALAECNRRNDGQVLESRSINQADRPSLSG
jgi:hypothetical protein